MERLIQRFTSKIHHTGLILHQSLCLLSQKHSPAVWPS